MMYDPVAEYDKFCGMQDEQADWISKNEYCRNCAYATDDLDDMPEWVEIEPGEVYCKMFGGVTEGNAHPCVHECDSWKSY